MDVQIGETKKRKKLLAEERAAVVLLLIISVCGIYFGLKSFPANLSRPFEIQLSSYTGEKFMTSSEKEAAEIELQKITDTDSDGLMDYDELYVYKTSPYLLDSDSDGFDDKTEILSNNNPNCPQGKDCLNSQVTVAEVAGDSDTGQDNNLFSGILNFNTSQLDLNAIQSTEDLQALFSQMGVKEVRSLLISQGVPKEQVDALSDEEIMSLLQVSIEEAATGGQFDEILNEVQSSTTTETPSDSSASQSE